MSCLNSTLKFGGCVVEKLTFEVVICYGSCKLVRIFSFGCKVPLWCVLVEKEQLRRIGTPRTYSLFGG